MGLITCQLTRLKSSSLQGSKTPSALGYLGDRIGLVWGRRALSRRAPETPHCSIPSQPRWEVQCSGGSEDTQHGREARAGVRPCRPPFCPCVLPASTCLLSRHIRGQQRRECTHALPRVLRAKSLVFPGIPSPTFQRGPPQLLGPSAGRDSGWETHRPLRQGRGLPTTHAAWKEQNGGC